VRGLLVRVRVFLLRRGVYLEKIVIQLKPIIDVCEIPPCASRSRQGACLIIWRAIISNCLPRLSNTRNIQIGTSLVFIWTNPGTGPPTRRRSSAAPGSWCATWPTLLRAWPLGAHCERLRTARPVAIPLHAFQQNGNLHSFALSMQHYHHSERQAQRCFPSTCGQPRNALLLVGKRQQIGLDADPDNPKSEIRKLPAAFIERAKQNGWRFDPSLIPLCEVGVEAFDAIPAVHSLATNEPVGKPTAIAIG
jgi:hypothetical protein